MISPDEISSGYWVINGTSAPSTRAWLYEMAGLILKRGGLTRRCSIASCSQSLRMLTRSNHRSISLQRVKGRNVDFIFRTECSRLRETIDLMRNCTVFPAFLYFLSWLFFLPPFLPLPVLRVWFNSYETAKQWWHKKSGSCCSRMIHYCSVVSLTAVSRTVAVCARQLKQSARK